MRSIEFRAWDKNNHKMTLFSVNSIYEPSHEHSELSNYVTMQFTGLLDKNGTKIFEGDIVKYEHTKLHFGVHQIVYVDKAAAFLLQAITPASSNPMGMKYLGDIVRSNGQYDTRTYELCEVIGNIYESPELLK